MLHCIDAPCIAVVGAARLIGVVALAADGVVVDVIVVVVAVVVAGVVAAAVAAAVAVTAAVVVDG